MRFIFVFILLILFIFQVPAASAITVMSDKTTSNSAKPRLLKEQFQEKREEFKEKLQALKDERKKAIVERVDKLLNTINQNWAQRMDEAIKRLENLLTKFSERAAKLKAEGKNTQTIDTAIADAKTAIQAAKDAVEEQAAKEYVADLSDETRLKSTVGEAMVNLRRDLKTAREVVKTAKQKVIDVARALAKLKPSESETVKPTQTSTPSATTTPEI